MSDVFAAQPGRLTVCQIVILAIMNSFLSPICTENGRFSQFFRILPFLDIDTRFVKLIKIETCSKLHRVRLIFHLF